MMHQFNRTMEYLESKLDAEVDLQQFQQLSGYSYVFFSRLFKSSIGADKIASLIKEYPLLNLEWLLTGEGDMIK